MKKRYIAAVLIAVLAVVLVTVGIIHVSNSRNSETEPTSVPFAKAQLGITVDSWLKIIEIDEYNGRLAVIAENLSEDNVEYAMLTVETRERTLSFKVSAVLSGAKVVLLCNEPVGSDPYEEYTSWQIKDKILYETPPVMNEDKVEIEILDGSISVKNISDEDLKSDLIIYYKDKKDDLLNGSVTCKLRVDALKEGSQTYIKASEHNPDNCQVIFTEYD